PDPVAVRRPPRPAVQPTARQRLPTDRDASAGGLTRSRLRRSTEAGIHSILARKIAVSSRCEGDPAMDLTASVRERLKGLFPDLIGIELIEAAPERVSAALIVRDEI